MGLTIEIARFTVNDGAEEAMLAERPAMVEAVRRAYPSHRDAYLTKLEDGSWMDVVVWGDRREALEAAEGFYEHPEIARWFRHVDELTGFEYGDIRLVSPTA
jgi:hypothetical protein